MGDFSVEQEARFHQDIKQIEWLCQEQQSISMIVNYIYEDLLCESPLKYNTISKPHKMTLKFIVVAFNIFLFFGFFYVCNQTSFSYKYTKV